MPTAASIARLGEHRSGSGGITAPTDITNCVVWLDAGQIAGGTNGGALSSWPDMSGVGNNVAQATGANQPKLWTGTPPAGTNPNGRPLVFFGQSGATTYMDSGAINAATATVFVVTERTSATAPTLFDKAAAGTGRVVGYFAGNTSLEIFAGTSLNGTVTGGPDSWFVGTFLSNGASSKVRKDGAAVASGNAGSNALGSIRVGADQTTAGHLSGGIAELIAYSRALSATEYGQVEAYLKTKYATP